MPSKLNTSAHQKTAAHVDCQATLGEDACGPHAWPVGAGPCHPGRARACACGQKWGHTEGPHSLACEASHSTDVLPRMSLRSRARVVTSCTVPLKKTRGGSTPRGGRGKAATTQGQQWAVLG